MQFPPASLSLLAAGRETGMHASYVLSLRARKMVRTVVHKNLEFSTMFRRIPQRASHVRTSERDEAA